VEGAADRITEALLALPGVQSAPHRFGGTELTLGRRELGHLHGDRIADIPLPRTVRDQLVASGRARPHHVLPESGWVTVPCDSDDQVDAAIGLLRDNYERALAARERRGRHADGPA
jgi:hypothetical protein